MPKRVLQGVVVSDKNDKTVVVQVTNQTGMVNTVTQYRHRFPQRRKSSFDIVQQLKAAALHYKKTVTSVVIIVQHPERPVVTGCSRTECLSGSLDESDGNTVPVGLFKGE